MNKPIWTRPTLLPWFDDSIIPDLERAGNRAEWRGENWIQDRIMAFAKELRIEVEKQANVGTIHQG